MNRREFITLLGGVAAWPRAAAAQQPAMPVIGFLSPASPDANVVDRLRGFRQGLKDTGYVDGENVTIMYRWAEGQFDRLPALAAELLRRPMALLVATGGDQSVKLPRQQQRRHRLSSSTAPIRSGMGWSRVSTGPGRTLPE